MSIYESVRLGTGSLSRVIALHLAPDTDLLKAIKEVVKGEKITAGIILSGAGSLKQCVLRNVRTFPERFPITDQNRVYVSKAEPLELLSLTGNIALRHDGEVVVHGHIVISSGVEGGHAYGGHLVEGSIVFSTMEVLLAEITGLVMSRAIDPQTQAAELYF